MGFDFQRRAAELKAARARRLEREVPRETWEEKEIRLVQGWLKHSPKRLVIQALDESSIIYTKGFVIVDGRVLNSPDFFTHAYGRKIAVFVRDCFYFQHTRCRREFAPPTPHWKPRLEAIHDRDLLVLRELARQGIPALSIWHCHVETPEDAMEEVLRIERRAENWSRNK